MSEIHFHQKSTFRYSLLVTASSAALLMLCNIDPARADEGSDHAQLWIELGAQFERLQDRQESYLPPFISPAPSFVTFSPEKIQHFELSDFGGEGKLEFRPEGTPWVFAAAARYGRSSGNRHRRQEEVARAHNGFYPAFSTQPYVTLTETKLFGDVAAHQRQSHTIVDFSAGRDVGIGLFGRDARSTLSVGVRFAQFSTKENVNISAVPTAFQYRYFPFFHVSFAFPYPHAFHATELAQRGFHGIGPSLSWDTSIDVVHSGSAALSFDWGANAAILFGKQKARIHTQTAEYLPGQYNNSRVTMYRSPADNARDRSIVVPNLGGFASVSFRWPNAKLSLGYRADFFFDAMDDGIAMRTSKSVGLYGPFATVSVGLGG